MVFVTVNKYSKDFTLVETPKEQIPDKRSLCEIFNGLEREGYKLVSSGGSAWELVFVFHKEGIVEENPDKAKVNTEEKKDEKKKDKEHKDKEHKDKDHKKA
jgi:hypothetical protein